MSNCTIADELELCSDRNRSVRTRRSSAPEQGMSLETATAARGKRLRAAVAEMAIAFGKCTRGDDFRTVFAPRYLGSALPAISSERIAQRTAWNLACIWLLC